MTQRKTTMDVNDLEAARTVGSKNYDSVRLDEEQCGVMYEQMELKQQDRFIRRQINFVLLIFLISFIAMAATIVNGVYREVVLAENIMLTVLGTSCILIVTIMCHSDNKTLKVGATVCKCIHRCRWWIFGWCEFKLVVEKLKP